MNFLNNFNHNSYSFVYDNTQRSQYEKQSNRSKHVECFKNRVFEFDKVIIDEKISLRIIAENEFDFKKNRDQIKFRFKNQTYVTKKKQKNVKYYDSKNEQDENVDKTFKQKKSFVELFTMVFERQSKSHETFNLNCKKCKTAFNFNNKFYKHFRNQCLNSSKNAYHIKIFESQKSITKNVFKRIEPFMKNSKELLVIMLSINLNRDINTKFEFRKYQYTFAKLTLNKKNIENVECFDNETNFTLTNREFFRFQSSKFIKKMITSITIRDINTNRYFLNEYAMIIIFFRNVDEIKHEIRVEFIKKINLINEFKTNVLMKIDILISKEFVLNFKNEMIKIENCKMTISIMIKRKSNIEINRIMNFKKTIMISSRTIFSIKIHHLNISSEKNFLFELNDLNFS